MSYILDALNKSHRQRQGQPGPQPAADDAILRVARRHSLWPLFAAMFFVFALAATLLFALWQATAVVPPAPPVVPVPAHDGKAVPAAPLADVAGRPRSAPGDTVAAPPAPVATIANTTTGPVMEPAEAPLLRSLPAEFRRTLPELAVTIHVYAPDEAGRVLYINNRQYRRGEAVAEGLYVEEILPDGALLSYRGQRFRLPRPN